MISRKRFTRDGETYDLERTQVFTFKKGKLFACWVYDPELADHLLRG